MMDLGIPKNIQNRIFEPLFSTKDDGFDWVSLFVMT